ncbi:MAG: cysteine desulfurase [Alphaproteobacteria bacterium]|nr:cysteine desulfurase [Alphaproteobacteria bacterium]
MSASPFVYLDHCASSPLLPVARQIIDTVLDMPGNPSSVHGAGRALRAEIERARDHVALLAGAGNARVVFTGSATEALTQAIAGTVRAGMATRMAISRGEHKAAIAAAQSCGAPIEWIGLTGDGRIDLNDLARFVRLADGAGERLLIAVHQVNNETGVIQPIEEIGQLLEDTPHILLVDAVQGFGRVPFEFDSGRADMVAISAHKIGGPVGVGALLVKPEFDEVRLIPGGGHEKGRRGGSQSAAMIAGFGAAAAAAPEVQDLARFGQLRQKAAAVIRELVPQAVFFGADAPRLASVLCFALPGLANSTALIGLDLEGVCVSAGSACSSGKTGNSHVLDAMGISDDLAGSALRLSVGWSNTENHIEIFAGALKNVLDRQAVAHSSTQVA